MTSKRATGLVWHELMMWHDTTPLAGFMKSGRGIIEPDEPSESSASKRRIKNLLDVSGLTEQLVSIKPRPATEAELLRVHTSGYIDAIRRIIRMPGGSFTVVLNDNQEFSVSRLQSRLLRDQLLRL